MSAVPEMERGIINLVEATETITAIDLQGEFDLTEAPTIFEHAQRVFKQGKHLIINLSDTTFIDSSIIHALFKADAAARNANRVFVLQFATHAGVERVLSITRADASLTMASTRTEAMQLIQRLDGSSTAQA